ncbi:bifunctional tRNA (5-methylaminomethyl-2-thiouridine)(34)-methyltransferase MnmD/FAD-dependent 5-carboxymethylaminomethyl-2-thiouridine(34) oxidoreductase MnmC [Marinobacter nauticus]|uniref:bifunctional tRNA (5-methylaminomethyl-2-thiouridine)(34)-methyltransferase MnmD/FAD-dependent 5-carboxymethylaminomethyl-2-thiouridine(34) oxidoreductase MnmC n=1 Tax=Marinobacter nauticus TaxID=2743 RepID=UPI001C59D2F6|nr:bifunctional tRNA (5-methylaminomethyl-2-thiouridine)(34)-methyltransferase MnmD/FAD-dependent 5-carboxymethylaminomethyl-2-thiouridine(34) oxidoreductase MnmC [Marinobacter nauticus]MBW3196181.1 bifunctional tRNA (5-methylaminomethyl-2-thiouridine)(34)-methyltransferase MnmD/FAD-dependent 5-carboxymethylaminomethyl-2-thiouridine(34) oxidoreductase MnmC [Marinobacter nauticus]MBY6181591.1 bifunctional tRNA (5-methylaminomethyl-2-thiouridine)(34)-methyltransferase MnmD/FAD-dependent 5-carboxyme
MINDLRPPAMEPAELIWRDGVPESARFGDVYFSRDDGLAETRYVFIERNGLPGRFAKLDRNSHFVIAETGFGTGLNFLATWAEWLAQRPDDKGHAILHFISVERYPLSLADLEKALESWPGLQPLARELIENYPPLIKGTHRLVLGGGAIRLTLCFGDVLDAWNELEFVADAWFLDGFAPSLNPDMWLEKAIHQIRAHSQPGTTLATFTSVGRVRRALADEGFEMAKVPGFGRKREMLTGRLPTSEEVSAPTVGTDPIVIIGAGIAGTALARNLAERGVPVVLADQASGPGAGASGNDQGALYVKLGVEYNDQTELAATALCFSQRFYQRWQGEFWHPSGLLQLAATDQEQDRQKRFLERSSYPENLLGAVSPTEASRIAGIPVQCEGLWFPGSGWLQPARACKTLIEHPLIRTIFGFKVDTLKWADNHWVIQASDGRSLKAAKVVVAAGHESTTLAPVPEGQSLRLKRIRGQVTRIPADDCQLPDVVICGTKYLNPAYDGSAITGATFDLRDDNPEPTPKGHQENLDQLRELLPSVNISEHIQAEHLQGRVGFRCTTHDYQPVAGPCPGNDETAGPGVYLLTGFGSKGLVWAPLLAEYLADRICQQPACLNIRLARRVETGRLYRNQLTV